MSLDLPLQDFESLIGYGFQNQSYLIEALTHRSFLNENLDLPISHNERLEFLGDAILELIVTEHLWRQYPDKSEGDLTNYRAALVKGAHLAEVSKRFRLEDFLQMSRGERADMSSKAYITANACEAVIAALYLDGGLEIARKFVETFILVDLASIIENRLFVDSKSYLQEQIQEKHGVTPSYQVIQSWGPDHDKTFEVAVYVGDQELARGVGSSKQKAEQDAAKKALETL